MPFANAVTAVVLVAYLICSAIAIVSPEFLLWLFQPWFHGLSLAPLRPAGEWFRPSEFAIGLITLGGSAWLGTAAMAGLYNRWTSLIGKGWSWRRELW